MSVSAYKFPTYDSEYITSLYFLSTENGSKAIYYDRWVVYNKRLSGGTSYFAVGITEVNVAPGTPTVSIEDITACTTFLGSLPSATTFVDCGTTYKPNAYSEIVFTNPEAVTLYTRSATASSGGTVAKTGSGYSAVSSYSATPTANSGYRFIEWRKVSDDSPVTVKTGITISSTSNKITIAATLLEDVAVYAYFIPNTVYVSAAGTGGSVKLYIDGNEQASASNVAVSTYSAHTVRVVATCNYNYTWAGWDVAGGTDSALADYTFTMPYNDVTATAVFTERPSFTLSVTKDNPAYGTVSVTWTGGGESLEAGGAVVMTAYTDVQYTLHAVPSDTLIYKFAGWYSAADTLLSTLADYAFTATSAADTDIVAKFAQNPNYTLTTNVSNGANYAEGNTAEAAGNTVVVTPAPDFTSPSNAWLSTTDIVIIPYPAVGWHIASWFIDATEDVSDPVPPAAVSDPLTFNLASDSVVTANFEPNTYAVTVGMDEDSSAHGTVSMTYTPSGGPEQTSSPLTVKHGDTVSITCTPAGGYTFEGWYKDGVKVDGATSAHTTAAVTEVCAYTAKLTAVVSIVTDTAGDGVVGFYDAAGAALTAGVTAISGGFSCSVTLGESIRAKATSASGNDIFQKWYVAGDGTKAAISGYAADVTFTVTATASIKALFSASPVSRFLLVTNGAAGSGKGTVSSSEGTAIARSAFAAGVGTGLGTLPDEQTSDKHYSFDSIASPYVGCTPTAGNVFLKWQILRDGDADYSDYSTDVSVQVVMTLNCILRAVYVTSNPLLIKAEYATGSDTVTGSLVLQPTGSNPYSTAQFESAYHMQGVTVTMTAIPSNGYVFSGWFASADGSGTAASTSATYSFAVSTAKTLYAKFEQDTDAVYLWEGGSANKMMEWRSKRFVASRPFNPSAALVYAASYPVTLNLYMSSSPDAPSAETPTVAADARKQDGYRLPAARAEKYLEVEVVSSAEVDSVVVSTSMGGLAQ